MDDQDGGTFGDGPAEPPPTAGRIRPQGSPGHKCKAQDCECWVHDNVATNGLCRPGCTGPTDTDACCLNGVCKPRRPAGDVLMVIEE